MSLQESIDAVIARSDLDPSDKEKLVRLFKLLSKRAQEMNGPELKEAREACGLNWSQAGALLGMLDPAAVLVIEAGGRFPNAAMHEHFLQRMNEVYGLGGK